MLTARRAAWWAAAMAALTTPAGLAQEPRSAGEATAFYMAYHPADQVVDAVRAIGLAGCGGGVTTATLDDKKGSSVNVTATPDQAERLARRLLDGVWAATQKAGVKASRPDRWPGNSESPGFRFFYDHGGRRGEVTVGVTRDEARPVRGAYRYQVYAHIYESDRPSPRP